MGIFTVKSIGKLRSDGSGVRIELEKEFIPTLTNLEGFGYINVLWWFHQSDTEESRSKLVENLQKFSGYIRHFCNTFSGTSKSNRPYLCLHHLSGFC